MKNGQIEKENLDQYFTPQDKADEYALMVVERFGVDATYIEPTAGAGAFVQAIINAGVSPDNVVAFDLDPKVEECAGVPIIQMDFNDLSVNDVSGRVVIGNPPYGKGGSLAMRVMNHLTDCGAIAVCFLNPLCVGRKHFTAKTIHEKLHLIDSRRFPENVHFIYPNEDGKKLTKDNPVRCEFQIWEKKSTNRPLPVTKRETDAFSILSVTPMKGTHPNGRSKEFEMGERTDYNAKYKGNIDFTIISHGTKAGQIIDFDESHKCTVKMFVKVSDGYDVSEVRKKLEEIDLTELSKFSTISHNPSISPSEIIEYVESKWKVEEKKETEVNPLSFCFS